MICRGDCNNNAELEARPRKKVGTKELGGLANRSTFDDRILISNKSFVKKGNRGVYSHRIRIDSV